VEGKKNLKLGSKEMQHKARAISKQTQMNIPIALEDKKKIVTKNETWASFLYIFFIPNPK
jgi:hypothetical protein